MTTIYCAKPGCREEVQHLEGAFCAIHTKPKPKRKPMENPRGQRVWLRFTDQEMLNLSKRAELEGVEVVTLIRMMLLSVTHPDTVEASQSHSEAGTQSQPETSQS